MCCVSKRENARVEWAGLGEGAVAVVRGLECEVFGTTRVGI